MKKTLLTILVLVLVSNFLLKSSESAEIIDQIILIYVGSPEEWPHSSFHSTIRRINKTHQMMQPVWTLNEPLSDEIWTEAKVYRQDHGGWHPFFTRILEKMCSLWFSKGGMAHSIKKTFVPYLPDECPMKPAVYNMSPIVIPRYRKDWIPEMQAFIPPMLPAADKWRVDCRLFNKKNEQLTFFRMEFRLINMFSSQ